jgi:hypothetical protein
VRVSGPEIAEDVVFGALDRDVRARLRTLSKDNADVVGRHLVMTGRLLDSDPELAYEHAQAAVRRGGRVDVVREAAGLAAYRTGRFAEALRELRTVRRLNGSSEHLPIMADCERGLERPERAVALWASPEAEGLDPIGRTELAMVVSGARLDLDDPDAALAVLSDVEVGPARGLLAARVAQARAEALRAGGRDAEAEAVLAPFPATLLAQASGEVEEEDDVILFDLDEEDDLDAEPSDGDGEDDADDVDPEDAQADEDAADTDEVDVTDEDDAAADAVATPESSDEDAPVAADAPAADAPAADAPAADETADADAPTEADETSTEDE